MTPETLKRALARTEASFLSAAGAEPLLARREAGRPGPKDKSLAAALARELRARQLPGGSWGEDLVETAAALELLLELAPPADGAEPEPAARNAVAWLRRRQGAPGRYGDGCTPERHEIGVCNHYLAGFFAPGTAAEATLASGAVIPAGPAALIAASCAALRSLLRWRVLGSDVVLHVEGVLRLLCLEPRQAGELVPEDAVPAMLAVLLEAPARPDAEGVVDRALERLVRSQRADGSWPELDAFHVLDVLLTAARAGHGSDALDAAVRRGAGLLAVSQHADGTWDRNPATHRTRIAWRALRYGVMLDEARREPREG